MKDRCTLKLIRVLLLVLIGLVILDIGCFAVLIALKSQVYVELLVIGLIVAVLTLLDMAAILYVSLIAHQRGEI